ncbi:MAG: restriction endonuclease [Candidatus Levybacteria bacterium]|nr:restriction endonuclease [Candidatus Levybacteria bacterium]
MVQVIKADGSKEAFDEQKVVHSIQRAKIPADLHPQVLAHVKNKLYEDIPTAEIYHHIIEFLGKAPNPYVHSRYSLKQALMALGPSGYPFEDYVAEILKDHKFTVSVRQILLGRCISHEIDVIAEKDKWRVMVEVKFHNSPGVRSDVHVPLYTKARYEDLRDKHNLHEAWIVTNTKTTSDAIAYAHCIEMKVISWSYPEGESLRDLIEKAHLYPITMMSTLSESSKITLLNNHIVLCKDICKDHKKIDVLEISAKEKEQILAEIEYICMDKVPQ